MTIDLLRAIQHADSAFPSGSFAFSQGLEGLAAMQPRPNAAEVERFIRTLLTLRWRTAERIALVRAHRSGEDLRAAAIVDQEVETSTLAEALRTGSQRNGMALLTAHVRLGTPRAADYQAIVQAGRALGHLAVIQGILWRAIDVSERTAIAMSGYGVANGIATAAIRLGLIGALDAQRIVARILPLIAEAAEAAVSEEETMSSYAPLAEIAAMRHARQPIRLFSN